VKRSIITFALAFVLGAGSAYAQEHGEPGAPAEGHHGLTEGFHAPEAPFNMTSPTPVTVRTEHNGAVTETKGPPPFIGPLINFGILVVLGYMAVKRQVNPALAARRAASETEIAEAKRLHDEAQVLHKEYTDRIANLSTELAALKADFVKQGEAERDRIVADAHARAEKMRAEGTQVIEQELRALREELRRDTVLAAVTAAEEAVRKNITAADQSRLVDDFVQSLEREIQTPTGGARA
jgi:F-type H+-transporting ATPase subunit b